MALAVEDIMIIHLPKILVQEMQEEMVVHHQFQKVMMAELVQEEVLLLMVLEVAEALEELEVKDHQVLVDKVELELQTQ